jgi:hypothetical protein
MLCLAMMVAGAGLYAYLSGREKRGASRPPAAVAAPRPGP